MHRALAATFAAFVVGASLAIPGIAHAAESPDDTYVDSVARADLVLVGQVLDVRPGRLVHGCQLTAATVSVEEVILGEATAATPEQVIVEFVGDCVEVGALGGAIPAERTIWFLVNKGSWLREFVTPMSGDWSEEDDYWRPLAPDAMAVDRDGRLEQHGVGSAWLPSVTFSEFIAELRDSGYLRSNEPQVPVGLGIWFSAQAYLGAAALFVLASLGGAAALMTRGSRRRVGVVIAGIAVVGMAVALVGGPRLARTVDFVGGLVDRTAVVESLRAGSLDHLGLDDHALPAGFEQLSNDGVVHGTVGPPTMAFFFTQAFFSPDPYCGYEYAQIPDALVLDPLGSGAGRAEDLGNGWYWVCAA